MLFQQTSAPTGWTKLTSSNDVALRVTSGTVGTGGSVAFETAFASKTPTITMSNSPVTLDVASIPGHNHYHTADQVATNNSYLSYTGASAWTNTYGSSTGGGGAHTHTNSASSSALDLNVSFVDVIIASKD